MNGITWLGLFIVLLVIEIFTMGLTTIWFAAGCLVAWGLAMLNFGLPVQVIAFIIVSVALFILTRPLAMKYFNKDREKTNAESLVGKSAIVLEQIDNLRAAGKVEVNGMEWTARSAEESAVIPKDAVVMILGIEGVKLIVRETEAKEAEMREAEPAID
ncbi:NfeD family protein [Hespellia stercorisuis]|uniref:Membrane protein implicated in regulation of membrane protease activity n=1 Tax=Hespellia stercorisuis DSM 15480 TaxID=1121950 RepID=A0A1M6NG47_9FIRM|nr:NfeD family protein [Hespellia stercorisuis]SHJ94563.1 Membrane protein implicated in regulation of membrane protease activity [Hespellia stercorisuis DSM 15480]